MLKVGDTPGYDLLKNEMLRIAIMVFASNKKQPWKPIDCTVWQQVYDSSKISLMQVFTDEHLYRIIRF